MYVMCKSKELGVAMSKEFKFDHVGLNDYSDDRKILGYVEMIHCTNCAYFITVYIPFGKTKKDYLDDKPCERCKCVGTLY